MTDWAEVRARDVTVLIPLFEPPTDFNERLPLLAGQNRVIVVDDGNSPAKISPANLKHPNVRWLRNSQNSGIAYSLNRAIADGLRQYGRNFVALSLDQDSTLGSDYIERALEAAVRAQRSNVPVGAVAAGTISGWQIPRDVGPKNIAVTYEPIQSGLLFDSADWARIGGFDEGLFIDGVDEDFCLRLLDSGFFTIVAEQAGLEHELGDSRELRILGHPIKRSGRTAVVPYHSPVRHYYISRNHVLLWRRHRRAHGPYVRRKARKAARSFLLDFIVSTERARLLKFTTMGFADGIMNRAGSLNSRRNAR